MAVIDETILVVFERLKTEQGLNPVRPVKGGHISYIFEKLDIPSVYHKETNPIIAHFTHVST